MRRAAAHLILFAFLLVGCVPAHTGSTYAPSQVGRAATVMKGTIVAMRDVRISGQRSGVGLGVGAAGGAVAGSAIGGDVRSNIAGAIGGAVVGGILGAVAEEAATSANAVEFVIQQDNGQMIAVVQTNEEGLEVGNRVLILRSDRVRITRDRTVGN